MIFCKDSSALETKMHQEITEWRTRSKLWDGCRNILDFLAETQRKSLLAVKVSARHLSYFIWCHQCQEVGHNGQIFHCKTKKSLYKFPGLFQQVIAMSGSAANSWAINRDPIKLARKQAALLNCTSDTSENIVSCLQDVSAEEIANSYQQLLVSFLEKHYNTTAKINLSFRCRLGVILIR